MVSKGLTLEQLTAMFQGTTVAQPESSDSACVLKCDYCKPGEAHRCRRCGAINNHRTQHCPMASVPKQDRPCVFNCGYCPPGVPHKCLLCGELNDHRSVHCPTTVIPGIPGIRKIVGATMVILVGDEYLLTTEASGPHAGKTGLPGGRVDPGETPEQAAIRETKEEVGIVIHPVNILGSVDYQHANGTYTKFYITRLPNYPTVTLDDHEISSFQWARLTDRIPGNPRPGFITAFNAARQYIRDNAL